MFLCLAAVVVRMSNKLTKEFVSSGKASKPKTVPLNLDPDAVPEGINEMSLLLFGVGWLVVQTLSGAK